MCARIVDPASLNLDAVVADREEILRWIPQRFEMRHVDAIVLEDHERVVCVGFKDVREDEFWVNSYLPSARILPCMLVCEAAAQVSSYCATKFDLLGSSLVGLGGMENVRFHAWVQPGDRLIVAVQLVRVRRKALIVCRFECYVGERLVAEGEIRGVALHGMLPAGNDKMQATPPPPTA